MAQQVAGVRDAIFGLALVALAVGVLLIAIAFALLAAFWALSHVLPNWQAALLVSGAALFLAFVTRLIGMHYVKGRGWRRRLAVQQPNALSTNSVATTTKPLQGADSLTLVALALLAGVIVGHRIRK